VLALWVTHFVLFFLLTALLENIPDTGGYFFVLGVFRERVISRPFP